MIKKIFLATFFILSGCTASHGNFTILSNRLVDVNNINANTSKKVVNAEGKDISHIVVIFQTKANPNLNDALNDVFRKTDTDVLTDAEITTSFWMIPYIYGQVGWKVRGTAIKTRNN